MQTNILQANTKSDEPGFNLETCFNEAAQNGYIKDPDYYFDSYSHFSIHEDMLKDTVRTKAYQEAIMNNPEDFKDKVVLDIGSGTGVLSIFAAKAGAKHVYAIEKAGISIHSRKIIQQNGLTDKITVICGKVEEVQLPVDKVDTIVSEWMGYFLIYESMLDTVLYARDRWLRKGGAMYPNWATLYIAGFQDQQYYYNNTSFWEDVYGFSFRSLKYEPLKSPQIFTADPEFIVTDSTMFVKMDLLNITVPQLDFKAKFVLQGKKPDVIHGFVTWFTVQFPKGTKKEVVLSTSPAKKSTHWKQTMFYLNVAFPIGYKQVVEGTIDVRKAKLNPREIDVEIEFHSGNFKHKQDYRVC